VPEERVPNRSNQNREQRDSSARNLAQSASIPNNKEEALTVTVVICTRNRPALLAKCLAAVSRLDPAPDQVLVVDNSEGKKETEKTACEFRARYVVEPVRGLSRARNRGLSECDTDIVAYLDDDAIPAPDWLGILLEPFYDEKTAASTGRVVTPESPSVTAAECPRTLNNRDPQWFEITTFGGMGLGGNMALRRSACIGWTVFDERLGRGAPFHIGEEAYAFAGLLLRGLTAAYLPAAVVFHPPLRRDPVEFEARNSLSYWLLLFSSFPSQRLALLRFLFRRLRRKPLTWPRETQEPGEIVTSGWRVLLKAGLKGVWLFLKTPRDWNTKGTSFHPVVAVAMPSSQELMSRSSTRSH
jgi:glycosyltransferase involved in cell wall biosynthesis